MNYLLFPAFHRQLTSFRSEFSP